MQTTKQHTLWLLLFGYMCVSAPAFAADPDCWVKLYVRENLDALDTNDTIHGPGQWPTMLNLPGAVRADWSDAVNSLQIGPKARGYFWEDANFIDDMIEFGPGRVINRLDEYNFGDEIDAMKIECLS